MSIKGCFAKSRILKGFSFAFIIFSILTHEYAAHGLTRIFNQTFLGEEFQAMSSHIIGSINYSGLFSLIVISVLVLAFFSYFIRFIKFLRHEGNGVRDIIVKSYKKILSWNSTVLILLIFIAFLVRLRSLGLASCVSDTFLMPNIGAKLAQEGVFGGAEGFFSHFNVIVGAESVNRGFLYSLSTVIPYGLFGVTDVSARLPAIVFGLTSILLMYKLGGRIFNEKVGLMSAFFMTVSGWSIGVSTFPRDYILLVMFTLLSLFMYLRYREERTGKRLFLFCFSLGLLLSLHSLSLSIFSAFVIFVILDFLFKDYKTELLAGKLIALFLMVFSIALLVWKPIPQFEAWIIQYSQYQFGFISSFLTMLIIVGGSLFLFKKRWGYLPVILFYLPFILVSFGNYFTKQVLFFRYTSPFYPFFLIFLSVFIVLFIKKGVLILRRFISVDRRKLMVYALVAIVSAVVILSPGFFSPWEEYSREDVRPDFYELRDSPMKGEMREYPLDGFKFGYQEAVEPALNRITNDNIPLIHPGHNLLYWYTRVNTNTKNNRLIPYTLAIRWDRPKYMDGIYPNLPVVGSMEEFRKIKKEHEIGFVFLNGYDYRVSPEFRNYLRENLKTETRRKNIEVYFWSAEHG